MSVQRIFVHADLEQALLDGFAARMAALKTADPVLAETNPARDAKVSTLEVFGPVTCVYPYTRLEDALTAANAPPRSFQASIFNEDLRTAFAAAERLAASAVMVNDPTAFRTDWMPFAGRRQSGYGVGGIPYTMREMTEEKMIVFRM